MIFSFFHTAVCVLKVAEVTDNTNVLCDFSKTLPENRGKRYLKKIGRIKYG